MVFLKGVYCHHARRRFNEVVNLGSVYSYGYTGVRGNATNTATVTVNGNSAWRLDEYFYGGDDAENSASAVMKELDIMAVVNPSGTNEADLVESVTGKVFVAKSPEAFTYDDDGNMLSDGRFTYTWDGENRLVSIETSEAGVSAGAARVRVEYSYDHRSRRIGKVVSHGGAEAQSWDVAESRSFVYDNWNMIQELTHTQTHTLTNSYTWGLDLSGALQGAGGVGGLLAVAQDGTAYHPAVDGNGNVMEYVSTDGTIVAHYEYSPFGETIIQSGQLADAFSFRFSTKYWENEAKLYYYGYRFYAPAVGRWLNRDPIGESGGYHLYMLTLNSPLLYFDVWGLKTENSCCSEWTKRYNLLYGDTVSVPYSDGDGSYNETLMKCIINRLRSNNNAIYEGLELVAVGGGVAVSTLLAEALKNNTWGKISNHVGGWYVIGKMVQVLAAVGNAGAWCREEKCSKFTEKVPVTKTRSTWNPMYWLDSPTYECEQCPEGSEEVSLDGNGEVWRDQQ